MTPLNPVPPGPGREREVALQDLARDRAAVRALRTPASRSCPITYSPTAKSGWFEATTSPAVNDRITSPIATGWASFVTAPTQPRIAGSTDRKSLRTSNYTAVAPAAARQQLEMLRLGNARWPGLQSDLPVHSLTHPGTILVGARRGVLLDARSQECVPTQPQAQRGRRAPAGSRRGRRARSHPRPGTAGSNGSLREDEKQCPLARDRGDRRRCPVDQALDSRRSCPVPASPTRMRRSPRIRTVSTAPFMVM